MKIVHFSDDFYDSGVIKYKADSYQLLNSETQSLVNTGYASLVDAEAEGTPANVLAALADIAEQRAVKAEEQAAALRAEADAAHALAAAAQPKP